MEDPTLKGYNIDKRVDKFVAYFKSQATTSAPATSSTLRKDFTYTNSRMWYKNVDKLIKYINALPEYSFRILYSTPEDYIDAIKKEKPPNPSRMMTFSSMPMVSTRCGPVTLPPGSPSGVLSRT